MMFQHLYQCKFYALIKLVKIEQKVGRHTTNSKINLNAQYCIISHLGHIESISVHNSTPGKLACKPPQFWPQAFGAMSLER